MHVTPVHAKPTQTTTTIHALEFYPSQPYGPRPHPSTQPKSTYQTLNTEHQKPWAMAPIYPPPNSEACTPSPIQYQTLLTMDRNNAPWGIANQYVTPQSYFRVLSKNVSTINPQMLDMTAMATELQNCKASVFLAQETNTAWTPSALSTIHAQCKTIHHHLKLTTSSSAKKQTTSISLEEPFTLPSANGPVESSTGAQMKVLAGGHTLN